MRKAIKAFAYEAGAVFMLALVLCAPRALFAAEQKGVSKSEYLDIMEAAVGAYTGEHLAAYLAEVEADGVQEHGFPRRARTEARSRRRADPRHAVGRRGDPLRWAQQPVSP